VVLGGLISMAILVVGTEMSAESKQYGFSYELLAKTLESHIGIGAVYVFGIGLFAAGFTSAITSPLISALTAKSIFGTQNIGNDVDSMNSKSFHLISYAVLAIGLIFGFLQIEPVPAIIMAQAFNGLILPFVSVFLFIIVNDAKIMGKEHVNGLFSNILMIIVTWVTMVLGFVKAVKAFWSIEFVQSVWHFVIGRRAPTSDEFFVMSAVLAVLITAFIAVRIFRNRDIKARSVSVTAKTHAF